jgi:putative ABC transport system permease protein
VTAVAMLDLKLLRDFRRLWPQAAAIGLVVAGGVASLVLSVGSFRSLDETRAAYYERYRFADVFASLSRAPRSLLSEVAQIPGAAIADGRIAKLALLDIADVAEPASGLFVSVPPQGEPILNRLYMKVGRMPDALSDREVVVSDGFAQAHGFEPGDTFSAILNGKKRELVIVGTALSPEFIYAIGPGDRMPDNWRFAVVWMPERALASAYGLSGAMSSVAVTLLRDASEAEVIDRLDALLDPYGGSAAYGRKDQTSHAFLEHGLDMLRNMSSTIPPIFMLVTAFLVNLVLSRLVSLEREQIGLLKALGYRNGAIAGHYLKFVLVIALAGIVVGSLAGTWLGVYVTQLFGTYYQFPFLVFAQSADLYALGAGLSLTAAGLGAFQAIRGAAMLPPAVAMQAAPPPRFRRVLPALSRPIHILPQPVVMMLRGLGRRPLRTTMTAGGIALATAVLIVSLFTGNAVDQLVDVTYFMADRQDATIGFVEKQPGDAVLQLARFPGVLAAEAVREVPIRIRYGSVERRVVMSGRPSNADLSRIIDTNLQPVTLPEAGLAISSYLAGVLGARVGDTVEIDLLEGDHRTVALPIATLVEDYLGIKAMMNADALARLLREAPSVNAVNVSLDQAQVEKLYEVVKETPAVAGVALNKTALANFRRSFAITITAMASIYTSLAAIIAFGVVYNSARISLSERARELASLRVLGFTRWETIKILLLELAFLTLIAQPAGWLMGYGLSWIMKSRLAGELMRVPMTMQNLTYVIASAIILVAASVSALIVARRVSALDLVAVLKTRD